MSERYDKVMEERKKLVDRIIENMKQGYILPKPLWDSSNQIHNPVSGARYQGANYAKLLIESYVQGYTDPRWMTFKQAKACGYQIKKGEKGIALEKYVFKVLKEEETEQINPKTGVTETVKEKVEVNLQRPIINQFYVYNASQIEGLPPLDNTQAKANTDALKLADQLIASSACPVMELNQPNAFYSPANDRITLPPRDTFISEEAFTTVLMHEMIHSTGHASRLNRPLLNKFGTPDYAREELRAELGSYFMGTDLGIEEGQKLLDSHTEYVESWIKVLSNNPSELIYACNDAQKAVEFLEGNLERQQELERLQEKQAETEEQLEANLEQPQETETESLLLIQNSDLSKYSLISVMEMDASEIVDALLAMNEDDRLNVSAYLESKGAWTAEIANEETREFREYRLDIRYNTDTNEAINLKAERETTERLLDSISNMQFDEQQYLHFTVNTYEGEQLEGTYRLLADANGPENTLIDITDEDKYPEIKSNWDAIRDRLAKLSDFEDIKRLSEKPRQEDLQAEGEMTEIRYPEPVVQIIYSSSDHPMLRAGNQLTFVEANQLFASLNRQRELELYRSDHITDPLFYSTDYKLIYQQDGIVHTIRDTYDIGAGEEDLLEHIMLSNKPIHEAYVHLGVHVRLYQQQQGIELNVKSIKAQIENLRLQESIMHDPDDSIRLEKAEGDLHDQAELLSDVQNNKNILAAGTMTVDNIKESTVAYMEQMNVVEEAVGMEA